MTIRRWFLLALGAWLVTAGVWSQACSVPVFRYALERWPADPYEVVVFHRGDLKDTDRALVQKLEKTAFKQGGRANLEVAVVDLGKDDIDRELKGVWDGQVNPRLPWVAVRYPRVLKRDETVWAGRLSDAAVDGLVQSPLRQKIARELCKGETAVWLLVESGDKKKDDAAAEVLRAQLKKQQETLKLPKLNPNDPEDRIADGPDAPELKISFTLHRLARTDAVEQPLLQMLLKSEEDLLTSDKPLAFPVFGRGRALYVLEGDGINPEVIEKACAALIGPCTCTIKAGAPGTDLLISADWPERMARPKPVTPTPVAVDPPGPRVVAVQEMNETEPVPDSSGLRTVLLVLVGGVAASVGVVFVLGKWRG